MGGGGGYYHKLKESRNIEATKFPKQMEASSLFLDGLNPPTIVTSSAGSILHSNSNGQEGMRSKVDMFVLINL